MNVWVAWEYDQSDERRLRGVFETRDAAVAHCEDAMRRAEDVPCMWVGNALWYEAPSFDPLYCVTEHQVWQGPIVGLLP